MGGRRIRIRRIRPGGVGADGGPTMVFLHEGLGTIEQWRDFPRDMVQETGLPALVYDRLGFGGSEPLQKERDGVYLQREDTSGLADILDAYDIRSPILVGHSDGGTIALLHASRFTERALGVIVVATHVFVEDATLNGIRNAVKAYEAGELREKLSRFHGAGTDDMFYRWVYDWLSPEFTTWNVEPSLPSITCPVLVIQGEEDEYGTLTQVEAIARGVTGCVECLLIPRCGHNPHLQDRKRVVLAMKRFIGDLVTDSIA